MPSGTFPTTDEQEVLARDDLNAQPQSRGKLAKAEEMDIRNGNPRFRTQDALDRHLDKNAGARARRVLDGSPLDILNTSHLPQPIKPTSGLDAVGKPDLSGELLRYLGEQEPAAVNRPSAYHLAAILQEMKETHPVVLLVLLLAFQDKKPQREIAAAAMLSLYTVQRMIKSGLAYIQESLDKAGPLQSQ